MIFEKTKAVAATTARFKTNLSSNYKQFPAYGKQFMKMRQEGKMPRRRVMVTFDWDLAQAYPRIVIADDTPAEKLNFYYLAGLPVQVVFRQKDAHRVSAVTEAILKINPSFLSSFAFDLADEGKAFTLIKPYNRAEIAEAA
jgi:hypothetical protein